MSKQKIIEVSGVRAGYTSDVDILCGISLYVDTTEIVTLLGANGCGKSTLLKTIAGFVRPHTGHIYIHGNDVSTMPVHEKSGIKV